ncbi:GNAT family N-acetyltransferase [Streptomyces ureilyticus]|uniref:GNAT family N-acetyltransferase n=1 Tax=Streptomyces ureilyticus TaxID=1775131 RepID=A0ABX0E971_9ACTN|nr:GNAT family N-acetyltransferase [Streptomyces ureilyticus]NGO48376.1 GNAT family N-acetyltransferase [Streptomyces ureilyticus]
MPIRPATPADLPLLQDIERAAGELFRPLGMPEIADDAPPSLDVLERFRQAGHAWVAEDDATGHVVAYLVGEPVDGAFHIEQVTVHPDAGRRGVGRVLIAYAAECARDEGLTALTLTTFADVPWNAPYYERLGFRALTGPELTPGLRKIRATEAEHGLDRWPRVCMRRDSEQNLG